MSDELEAPCRITWGRMVNLLIRANLPIQTHLGGSKELIVRARRRQLVRERTRQSRAGQERKVSVRREGCSTLCCCFC